MNGLRLPAPGHLPKTNDVDAAEKYFSGGYGWVLRKRLHWVLAALPNGRLGRVLEIGYGSGIFQYALAERADQVYGIDVHELAPVVRDRLADDGITSLLARGDGVSLPFADGVFDVCVILSALEFMSDPGQCLREAVRVTRSSGRVIALTPRVLPWADRLYKALVGFDPESEFVGGRQRVQAALADPGLSARRRRRPTILPRFLAPYEVVNLSPAAMRG
jgi:SAM-dependent methyltransferase